MGNAKSIAFSKDLRSLNQIIDTIVKDNNQDTLGDTIDDNKDCEKYFFVLESSLKRHLKVDLEELKDSIYVIPKNVEINYKKEDLCSIIANHYKRAINLLQVIKNVYDFENNGKYSIAGICIGNIE